MKLDEPDDYFDPTYAASHTAQGDVFDEVPFIVYGHPDEDFKASGARKRPSKVRPEVGLAVVLDYTCDIVAQPPGTVGYSHPFRLVAPVRPIRDLIGKKTFSQNDGRKLRDENRIRGLAYLPLLPEWYEAQGDEWDGHAAILIYAATGVTQKVLDSCRRVARMSADAQRILMSKAASRFLPHAAVLDPFQAELEPDRSDSWAASS